MVLDGQGELQVGRALPGRGAWLCRDSPECLARARSRKAFARALRRQPAPGAEERLAERLVVGSAGGPGGRVWEDRALGSPGPLIVEAEGS